MPFNLLNIAREARKMKAAEAFSENMRERLLAVGIDAQVGSMVKNSDDSIMVRLLSGVLEIETIIVPSVDGGSVGAFLPYRVFAKSSSAGIDKMIAFDMSLESAIEKSKKAIVERIRNLEIEVSALKNAQKELGD